MTEPSEPTYIIVQQAPPPAKRRIPRWAIAAVAAALLAGGAGTFASFSASTTNSGTFATGTLVLSNQKDAQTVCLSSVAGVTDTNDNGCDAAFGLTVKKPGDTATAYITLKNEGSIDASALKLFVNPACTTGNTGESYHGTGDLCSALRFYVQETNSSHVASTCQYGNAASPPACDFAGAGNTLAAFSTAYPDANTVLGLGAMTTGTTRYFTVGLSVPSTATNNVQGRVASFGLKWQIIQ